MDTENLSTNSPPAPSHPAPPRTWHVLPSEAALASLASHAERGLTAPVSLARGCSFAAGVLVAITLAVASIPEGLPAIITIALAIGGLRDAQTMAVTKALCHGSAARAKAPSRPSSRPVRVP
jgi:magnesium-transporting ATPase (P-type)